MIGHRCPQILAGSLGHRLLSSALVHKLGLNVSDDKQLSPEAIRALKEAEERRKATEDAPKAPKELGGRKGEDPARFGDWEKNGIAVDF